MVVRVQLDGGSIRVGCAIHVASGTHVSAHQVVLQNLCQGLLSQCGVGFQLHRQASFGAGGFAHACLQQHFGHLQVVYRLVGVQGHHAAITAQRLPHLPLAQQSLGLRFKVHQNRRTIHKFYDLVAQICGLGHGVALLDRVEGQTGQNGSVLFGGKLFSQ